VGAEGGGILKRAKGGTFYSVVKGEGRITSEAPAWARGLMPGASDGDLEEAWIKKQLYDVVGEDKKLTDAIMRWVGAISCETLPAATYKSCKPKPEVVVPPGVLDKEQKYYVKRFEAHPGATGLASYSVCVAASFKCPVSVRLVAIPSFTEPLVGYAIREDEFGAFRRPQRNR